MVTHWSIYPQVGDAVSLKKTSDGKLFIYKNRKLAAELDLNIPPNVYAVADVYGQAGQVSITGNQFCLILNVSNVLKGYFICYMLNVYES